MAKPPPYTATDLFNSIFECVINSQLWVAQAMSESGDISDQEFFVISKFLARYKKYTEEYPVG